MTVFTGGVLEIEFAGGSWTDVSAYYDLAAGVSIHQGRQTEFDEVGPATLTVKLWNDDGRFMPEFNGSPYYPNVVEGKRIRWKDVKAGVTYTRFTGWIQDIQPDFPSSNTTGAQVQISAVDALGLMAQRVLRSHATEQVLYKARIGATTCDAFEFEPDTAGTTAFRPTNYSPDSGVLPPLYIYNPTKPTPSFALDPDVSIGPCATFTPDDNGTSVYPTISVQANPKTIHMMVKCPREAYGTGVIKSIVLLYDLGVTYTFCIGIVGAAGVNKIKLYNLAGALVASICDAPFDQWVFIYLQQNGATATSTDIFGINFVGTTGSVTVPTWDIRTVSTIDPGNAAVYADAAVTFGGLSALGTRNNLAYDEMWTAVTGTGWTVGNRLSALDQALSQLPISFALVGTLSTAAVVGTWSARTALAVGQEIIRTGQGIMWARGRDSQVCYIGPDQARPITALATIDVDADAWGPPILTRSVDTSPTRVEVTYPGGRSVSLDSTAEAAGFIRTRPVSTVCASSTDADTLALALRTASAPGLRIKQITVDLTSGVSDLTSTLFSEASSISGLFPTARVRLANLPTTHFPTLTRDSYVQGWTEVSDTEGSRVILDTSPCPTTTLKSATFTGVNGTTIGAEWTNTLGAGAGSAINIQTNRARTTSGASAASYTRTRLNTSAAREALEITGVHRFVDLQATALMWARGDTTLLTDGYYISAVASTNTVTLVRRVASANTTLATWSHTMTTATDYGFRLRVAGKYIQARTWTGTEPATWNGSVVDTSPMLTAGYAGFGVLGDASAVSRSVDFDNIVITDGA